MEINICIPTYNRAKFLVTALESICKQTYTSWQCWIYDDGSTDNTAEAVRIFTQGLSKNLRNRIHYIPGPHIGHMAARRFFYHYLKDKPGAEWFAWVDSDDWCSPIRLKEQVDLIKRDKVDLCFSHLMWFSGVSPTATRTKREIDVSRWNRNVWSIHNNTNTATAVFNKKALECMPTVDINYGGWDTLWHMSFIMKDLKVGYVPLPLYYARRHEGRLSNAKKDPTKQEHRKEEQIKIRKYLEKLGVGLERPGKN